MRQKIERIVQAERAVPRRQAPAGLTTPLTQREVNSYLRYRPRVAGAGRASPSRSSPSSATAACSGEAVVDLDAVSRANRSKSCFDPMRLLTGRLPVPRAGRARHQPRHRAASRSRRRPSPACRCPKSVLQRSSATTRRSQDNPTASASTIRSRCRRRSARSASSPAGHRRAMSRAAAALAPARVAEGRRRSPCRRPGRRAGPADGRRSAPPLSPPLRRSRAPAAARRRSRPGRIASAIGTRSSRRRMKRTRRPGFSVFEVTLRDRLRHGARRVVQPALPARTCSRRPDAWRCSARWSRASAACSSPARSTRSSRTKPLAGGWLGATADGERRCRPGRRGAPTRRLAESPAASCRSTSASAR